MPGTKNAAFGAEDQLFLKEWMKSGPEKVTYLFGVVAAKDKVDGEFTDMGYKRIMKVQIPADHFHSHPLRPPLLDRPQGLCRFDNDSFTEKQDTKRNSHDDENSAGELGEAISKNSQERSVGRALPFEHFGPWVTPHICAR